MHVNCVGFHIMDTATLDSFVGVSLLFNLQHPTAVHCSKERVLYSLSVLKPKVHHSVCL